MKFMLICYDDEQAWRNAGELAHSAARDEAVRLAHDIHGRGQYLSASPLQPVATATCVRVRDGKRIVTDGPFAETREQLGGYYLVDVPDRETAIDIARRHPGARLGTVEVRPVMEVPGLPSP